MEKLLTVAVLAQGLFIAYLLWSLKRKHKQVVEAKRDAAKSTVEAIKTRSKIKRKLIEEKVDDMSEEELDSWIDGKFGLDKPNG